jgi:hypothetical protein
VEKEVEEYEKGGGKRQKTDIYLGKNLYDVTDGCLDAGPQGQGLGVLGGVHSLRCFELMWACGTGVGGPHITGDQFQCVVYKIVCGSE